MTHHLMGTAEIAERLGVSRQRVQQIETTDPTFPKPVAELSAGKVWESTDVEKWIVERRVKRRASRSRASDVGHTGSR
ncbi:DNA-binding protein [Frankia sp. CiP3]|uniref:helix-turn-helix transcriptional regulator n=1 Tax=Frankia sp. CiP3 TaxID=2880971 RepID=UPI0027E02BC6|nr:DNA-binding protein [Frankia sp. CiP3]